MKRPSNHKNKNPDYDTSLWEKMLVEREIGRERKRLDALQTIMEKLKVYFKDKKIKDVYIFGSILREREFYDFSDIDIAVEGLEEDYFRTLADVEDIVDRGVDLIELEKCRFGDAIKQRGNRVI